MATVGDTAAVPLCYGSGLQTWEETSWIRKSSISMTTLRTAASAGVNSWRNWPNSPARPPQRSRCCQLLQNDYAKAQIVPANDPRLNAEKVSFDSPKGKVSGYLVRAKGTTKRPAVIVIHENRGLNPHLEDVARRLATEGYIALAPDLLSVSGGTPANDDAAREPAHQDNREDMIVEAVAAISLLKRHAESTGKVGTVGFCFGGGVVNRMATDSAELDAGVPYYGAQPPADKVAAIKAPLLLQYAENDDNINKGIADFEAALKANNRNTPSTSIRARSTPSTTTPAARATTRARPTSPGVARSRSSRRTWALRRRSAEWLAARSAPIDVPSRATPACRVRARNKCSKSSKLDFECGRGRNNDRPRGAGHAACGWHHRHPDAHPGRDHDT